MQIWAIATALMCLVLTLSPSNAQQTDLERAERAADALREKRNLESWERIANAKREEIWDRFNGNGPGKIPYSVDVETLIKQLTIKGRTASLVSCEGRWSPVYDCEYLLLGNGRRNTLLVSYDRQNGRKIHRAGLAYLNPGDVDAARELVSILFDDQMRSKIFEYISDSVDPTKRPQMVLGGDIRFSNVPNGSVLYIGGRY